MCRLLTITLACLGIMLSGCGSAASTTDLASCQQAIDSARTMAGVAGDAFGIAAKYPPMVGEAAKAGALGDSAHINRIAKRMNRATDTLNAQGETISKLADDFNTAADACK